MDIPLFWDRPLTAWLSIISGFAAFSLIIYAILLMHGRLRRRYTQKVWK